MNTEITDTFSKDRRDWVCYDADCALCVRWVERFRGVLERRGFILMPLQSPAVRSALALPDDDLLVEMRVITREGRIFGGADALIYLSRFVSKPLFALTRIPGVTPLLRAIYRLIARNRTCGAGACRRSVAVGVPPAVEPRRLARRKGLPFAFVDFRVGNLADWLPLLLSVTAVAVIGRHFAPWAYMWSLALAVLIGAKWLCLRREQVKNPRARLARKAAFFFGWIGMDAAVFLASDWREIKPRHSPTGLLNHNRAWLSLPLRHEVGERAGVRWGSGHTGTLASVFDVRCSMFDVAAGDWAFASLKILIGAALIWMGARFALGINPLLAGWTGMIGLVFLLHFGLFHLLALVWRAAGVPVKFLMRAPLLSRSLGEFWGERWNTAFNEVAAKFLFRPLLRPLGVPAATMLVFLVSGLVHDLILSIPARGAYGLPTLYFLIQGAGVLFERTRTARRWGINGGIRGRVWTLLVTGAPVFWLFHPTFIRNVILPFLKAIGAT